MRSGGLKTLDAGDLKIHYGAFGAFMDLGDGWTAVAMTQALRRLSTHYSKGPQLTGDPALLKECREKLSGAGMSIFLRQGKDLLAAYNTVVALANLLAPYADEFLDPLGVDLALLPPGEEFLGLIRDGSLRMHFRPEGIRFHSHRLFTNTGWLAGIAAAGIAAGVAMPVFVAAPASQRATLPTCMSKLREIQKLGSMYADSEGTQCYPYSKDGGIAALQVLVEANDGLEPSLFICPVSGLQPATADAVGKFKLDAAHCSYEMFDVKVRPSDRANTIIVYDRTPCHDGKRCVVYIDSSVEVMDEAAFQKKLEEQRKRHSKGAEEGGKKSSDREF